MNLRGVLIGSSCVVHKPSLFIVSHKTRHLQIHLCCNVCQNCVSELPQDCRRLKNPNSDDHFVDTARVRSVFLHSPKRAGLPMRCRFTSLSSAT